VFVDLFLLGVVVQFFLAGLGVFRAKSHGGERLADSSTFDPHRSLGSALQVLALLILITALVSRRNMGLSVSLLVLMILQSVWTGIGSSAPAIAALHVVGALAIAVVAFQLHRSNHAPSAPA
jgi:putative flippase GtrA